jgi:hypothetical protein
MRKLEAVGALVLTVTAVAALAACHGSQGPTAKSAPGGSTDPANWPADDRSMCDYKHPGLESNETAGPGALKPNVRRVYRMEGEGDARRKTLVCREIDTNLDGIKDVVRSFNAKGEPVREDADTNYDGKIDSWSTFVGGRMSEEDLDTNHDGRPDQEVLHRRAALALEAGPQQRRQAGRLGDLLQRAPRARRLRRRLRRARRPVGPRRRGPRQPRSRARKPPGRGHRRRCSRGSRGGFDGRRPLNRGALSSSAFLDFVRPGG